MSKSRKFHDPKPTVVPEPNLPKPSHPFHKFCILWVDWTAPATNSSTVYYTLQPSSAPPLLQLIGALARLQKDVACNPLNPLSPPTPQNPETLSACKRLLMHPWLLVFVHLGWKLQGFRGFSASGRTVRLTGFVAELKRGFPGQKVL